MTTRFDDLVIGTKRRLRGVGARMDGLVGVFRTLAEQHAEILALAGRIGRDADKREPMWPTLSRMIVAHERAEGRVVVPALLAHDELRELGDLHESEAGRLEDQVELIANTYSGSDLWGERLGDLVDLLVEHAREEEREVFPQALAALGNDVARALDRDFERVYAALASAH